MLEILKFKTLNITECARCMTNKTACPVKQYAKLLKGALLLVEIVGYKESL
jgi:hypothetical protein